VPLLLYGAGVPAGRVAVPVESRLASRIAAAALGARDFGSDELPAPEWPLVAEQFRASLAYHQRLAAKTPETGKEAAAASRFDAATSAEPAAMQTGYDSADAGKSPLLRWP